MDQYQNILSEYQNKGSARDPYTNLRPPKQKVAGYDVNQLQQFSPEQMNLFQRMFSGVSPDSYTARLAQGDPGLFQEMEAPALRDFSELQGGMASRFSGMGSLGARRSSGFQNTMNQAASDFASTLASRRQELQRQAIMDLHNMSGNLLGQRPYEQFLTDKKKSWWEKMFQGASAAAPFVGGGLGFLTGGPSGAAAGWQAGSALNQGWNAGAR